VALAFVTWLWGDKYSALVILKLADGIRRNTHQQFRFIVVTDQYLKNGQYTFPKFVEIIPIPDPQLIGRGCFCRLRMFDPQWQRDNHFDDRIAALDLDTVITGSLDTIFNSTEAFMILQGVNSLNPCPFNCSVMMLHAGACSSIWERFTLEKAQAVPYHEFPDDQGWIWHVQPKAMGWRGGERSGVYAFQKPGWPYHADVRNLPHNARIVSFIGWRKPAQFADLPWMMQHWRLGN